MEKTVDEKSLLEELRIGNRSAFEALFQMHYRYLVLTAYQYLRDEHFSKDLVQDVFLDLWRRRKTLEIQEPSLRPYLRRAVINNSLTSLRKQKRINYREKASSLEPAVGPETTHPYMYDELQEVIERVVKGLPERCQIVFRMSRYENLSHKEIAETLNISTKTIENQMTKALKVLRLELKRYGFMAWLLVTWVLEIFSR